MSRITARARRFFGIFGELLGEGRGNDRAGSDKLAGHGFGTGANLGKGAFADQVAAGIASAGSQVYDPIGASDNVYIVFDYHDGVALVAEFEQKCHKFGDIVEVESRGRLVKEVESPSGGAA